MDLLLDLSDERRAVKDWLPADDRDVTNGLVIQDCHGKPACVRHGAMNRVHPVERMYRCSESRCGVGARMATDEGRLAIDDEDWVAAGLGFLAELERKFGPISDEIRAQVQREWFSD